MSDFNYQQWRSASAVTTEMLDSCLDRIAELEAEQAATDKAFELRKYLDTEQIWELRRRAEQAEAERDDWHHACDVAAENGVTIRRSLEQAEAELATLRAHIRELDESAHQQAEQAEATVERLTFLYEAATGPQQRADLERRWAERGGE